MLWNSRADWGAAPPTHGQSGWQSGQPTGIAIHYVGGGGSIGLAGKPHSACLATVRNLQHYAQTGGNGWTYSDLEYNLVACPHGYVIEGRGTQYQGAAQLNANSIYESICVLANVNDVIANTPLARATNDAIAYIQQHYPRATWIGGHRDTAGNPTGTNCPGNYVEDWIHAGRPGGSNPNNPPAPPPAPVQEIEVSGQFYYPYDKHIHRIWVAPRDIKTAKAGEVLHKYAPPSAAHPQGAIENMTQRYTKGLGAQIVGSEEAIIVPDTFGTVIELTTVDQSGTLVVWRFEGNPITWHCVPYFPA